MNLTYGDIRKRLNVEHDDFLYEDDTIVMGDNVCKFVLEWLDMNDAIPQTFQPITVRRALRRKRRGRKCVIHTI